MAFEKHLLRKYNVPGPRYTSYPTVPYWKSDTFDTDKWLASVATAFTESNDEEGISVYIHLPFCESLCTFCGCHKHIASGIPWSLHMSKLCWLNEELSACFRARPRIKS